MLGGREAEDGTAHDLLEEVRIAEAALGRDCNDGGQETKNILQIGRGWAVQLEVVQDGGVRQGNTKRETGDFRSVADEVIGEDSRRASISLTTRKKLTDLRNSLLEKLTVRTRIGVQEDGDRGHLIIFFLIICSKRGK